MSLCEGGSSTQYYLGASREDGSIWSWSNGESFVFTNWASGEPGNADSTQPYLAMNVKTGKWHSLPENPEVQTGFVCEWEGEHKENETSYWVEFECRKTEYAIGEEFEVDAWLYTNDSVIRIYDGYTVSGFDSSKPGACSVTVSYGDHTQSFDVEVTEDIEAEEIVTYVVRSSATEGVSVAPSGYTEVKDGTVMKFVVAAKDGYIIDRVSVNGENVTMLDNNLTVTVDQNTVIEVSGRKKTYSVSSLSGGNGYILLSSDTIAHGDSCTARIVANDGYIISDVKIDGISIGACKSYTFSDVRENHRIEAVFEKLIKTHTVRASAEKGGKVYPVRSVVNSGGSLKLTATPDYGYHTAYALANGNIYDVVSNEIYLDNITKDTTVSVVFEKNAYNVSVNPTVGAQIYAKYNDQQVSSIDVAYQSEVTLIIDVENGYKLNTLYENNIPVKATKDGNRLIYRTVITKNTVISARCGLTLVSEFNEAVAKAGFAANINASNAYAKKDEFTTLANQYEKLSEQEKSVCTSAYATVLSALDRANAYIALAESKIAERISALPDPNGITAGNYRDFKEETDLTFAQYEALTYLSKSLIDFELSQKLTSLKEKCEELDKESKGAIFYLYELIDAVPDGDLPDTDSVASAYSKLFLAENTYHTMSEEDKQDVSEENYNALISKHGRISTHIQKLYVTPFTGRVLRCSGVNSSDTLEEAEAKRTVIYELMNEYHSIPAFAQEQIADSTVQKLNALYESASVRVSASVNDLPVDMNGDFDENVELVVTEPELDSSAVAGETGKAVYQAIDVKMYSENTEVQPSSKIRIKMEITKELSDSNVSVVYIDDAGAIFDVQGEIIEENEKYYIVFFVDHFSNFAVIYNKTEATEASVVFDTEYAEPDDYITASVTGVIGTSDYTLYVAGYSAGGALTFAQTGKGSVSVIVPDGTLVVKAMVWDKALKPILTPASLKITDTTPPVTPTQPSLSFSTQSAKPGDSITATATLPPEITESTLYVAGYSATGALTFAQYGKSSVTAVVPEGTSIVRAMLWNKALRPLVAPLSLTVTAPLPKEASVSFSTQSAKVGDSITATATHPDSSASCILYVAGYSAGGTLTFVEKGQGSVSATVADGTEIVKGMLWNESMVPQAKSEIAVD